MMRAAALALAFGLLATPLAAAPFCHVPQGGGSGIHIQLGVGKMSETDKARFYELQLRRMGIDARDTVLWNECIQTTVHENGRFRMRFYDPFTLEEIPLD